MRIYLVKFCVENPSKPLFEMKRAISLSNDNGNRKWYKNLMIAMKIMQQQQGCRNCKYCVHSSCDNARNVTDKKKWLSKRLRKHVTDEHYGLTLNWTSKSVIKMNYNNLIQTIVSLAS